MPAADNGVVDAAELIAQVSDYAIIALDAEGTICSWNAGAERLKGHGAAQAVGQHFSVFYTAEDQRAGLPDALLAQARRDGSVQHTGWRVRRDGTRFWGDVIITALTGDDGRLRGYAKVTRDLTSRKRLEEARETFLDTIAHDLRHPVAVIAGFAEMLSDASPSEQADYIERIQTNARRLTAMTEDLVRHARVSPVGPDLDLVPLPLAELVASTTAALGDDEATSRIEVRVPDLVVLGDRAALERVVVNLLTNALKYSPDGSPITVSATARDDRVQLRVRDHGRGIDAADLPGIFDEFARGRLAVDDGGTGLGLTSVKLLAERMGGVVTIASEPGVGTRVTVVLSASPSASPSV